MNKNDCQEGKHYKLATAEGTDECVVYCYKNPAHADGAQLGLGFNIADGSGWLPLFDIPEDSVVNEISTVPIERLRDLVKVQSADGNWNHNEYMRGLANGLICSVAVLENVGPVYHDPQERDGVKEEIDIIRKAMKADDGYAWSWHCNIAMCAQDEGVDHATANVIASRFMKLCFDVETKDPAL